jgi:hypothetical protein
MSQIVEGEQYRPHSSLLNLLRKIASSENSARHAATLPSSSELFLSFSITGTSLHDTLDEELVNASNRFHEALATGDYKGFCASKAASAETESDKQVGSTLLTLADYARRNSDQ